MNMNIEPELTLNATIDIQPETESDLILDATIDEAPPFTHKTWKAYAGKLRLLSNIHREIASEINASRQATFELFFMPDDKYIEETADNCNMLALILNGMAYKERPV